MAPKRKANTNVSPEQVPPTKRITRSGGLPSLAQTQPVASVPSRTQRRSRATVDNSMHEPRSGDSDAEDIPLKRPVRRGRPRKLAKDAIDIPTPRNGDSGVEPKTQDIRTTRQLEQRSSPEASSSKVTIESCAESSAAEDSPDELLLRSPKPRPTRFATPDRTFKQTLGSTPRLVLDAVEITTPSRLRNTPRASPRSQPVKDSAQSMLSLDARRQLPPAPRSPSKLASPRLRVFPRHQEKVETEESDEPVLPVLASPNKYTSAKAAFSSPRKGKAIATPQTSPSRLPHVLPSHLHSSLASQKREALKALSSMCVPEQDNEGGNGHERQTNAVTSQQLSELLKGTMTRNEGNSCLIIGPRGSGKTQVVESALNALRDDPIVIRLSGHAQTNDRLAVREIAWQLAEQTGQSLLPTEDAEEMSEDVADNPFLEQPEPLISLPPPSHLLALISMIPTLPRPTVIVLDAFDLFALHARQALLYCLLDTVQSCRIGQGSKGLAVIGLTSRVDTINMLEKRVKSRFSGRMLRTACPRAFSDWIRGAKVALCTPIHQDDEDEWTRMWQGSVEAFFDNRHALEALRETFALSRDFRMLNRVLIHPVLTLKPTSAFLTAAALQESILAQRCPVRFAVLTSLNYPSICLLIAAMHAQTSGHDTFTFEMLHESFREQVRTSLSAPVQVSGGGIGMVRCSREVMFRTFERLISQRLFVATATPALGTGRQFVRYRCSSDRSDVKKAVEKLGQLNLKKWLSKAQ